MSTSRSALLAQLDQLRALPVDAVDEPAVLLQRMRTPRRLEPADE